MTSQVSQTIPGTALHCGRFGCVVRLEDGRIGNLSPLDAGHDMVRKAVLDGKRRRFDFLVDETDGRVRLSLAPDRTSPSAPTSSLDEKIIDYLRQTADWNPHADTGEQRQNAPPRAERLMPFEMRARRQYRDSPKRPDRKKH